MDMGSSRLGYMALSTSSMDLLHELLSVLFVGQ